jgi:hypothetical protein
MRYQVKPEWVLSAAVLCMLMLGIPAPIKAEVEVITADESGHWRQLAQGEFSDAVIVEDVRLDEDITVALALREINPFARDATLRRNHKSAAPIMSDRRYFRGRILGQPDSRVTISVDAAGDPRGLLANHDGHWILHAPLAGGMEARFETSERTAGTDQHDQFVCEASPHDQPPGSEPTADEADSPERFSVQDNNERYRVRVAFESTWRFRELFDSDQQAIDYLGDLINYTSAIYINDIGAELVISSINLWSSEEAEPWTQGSAAGLLQEFTAYWRDVENDVDRSRTIAHMVDAGSFMNGHAWIGVVCEGGYDELFDWDNSSDFAVSSGLDTDFHALDSPTVWSSVVVAHEIGHNFDSLHTHCYDPPVDTCWNLEGGCYDGDETSLPGEPGEGSGTIMSYCYARAGGLDNIAPSLGRDHPYGHEPDRVPDTMRAYMIERAQEGGRCPQVISSLSHRIFSSLSGSGSITPTSAQVDHGESVEFTVSPDLGYIVESASGCGGGLTGNTYTTAAVTADCNISVEFAEDENVVLWDRFEAR